MSDTTANSEPQEATRTNLLKKRTLSPTQQAPRTYLLEKTTLSPTQQAPRTNLLGEEDSGSATAGSKD